MKTTRLPARKEVSGCVGLALCVRGCVWPLAEDVVGAEVEAGGGGGRHDSGSVLHATAVCRSQAGRQVGR